MPSLDNHQSATSTKLLLIGHPGSGKSGSLASLALAGYNLRIIDFDNGLDILAQKIREKDPAALKRIEFETCTDKLRSAGGQVIPDGVPQAAQKAMNLMTNWKTPTADLGPVSAWGEKDVLVLDSFTRFGDALMRLVLAMNGRPNKPQIQDWGEAMKIQENTLALLYGAEIKCNVIIISHVTFIGGEEGDSIPTTGFPNALGKKLPPKVGSYFNSILLCKTQGSGNAAKRVIRTTPDGLVEVKHPAGPKLPATLPIETGLATFFEAVRSGGSDGSGGIVVPEGPAGTTTTPSGLVIPQA